MGDGDSTPTPKPPKLPDNAPAGLRDFVACRRMSVDIDTSDVGWLPMPPGMSGDAAPDVDLEPGADGRSGTVKIGWGFVSMEFPVRIVDGKLVVDETDKLILGIGDEIDKWVDRLNAQLGANDKALDEFRVDGDTLTITKRAAAPSPVIEPGGASTAPVVTATPVAGADEKPPEKRSGCLGWILGGIVALAAAIGIGVVATNGGDDDAVSTPPVATGESTTTTDVGTTTTTAATTTTTTMQVGLADEPTDDTADEPACATALPDELPVGEYAMVDDPCDGAAPVMYDSCTFGPLCAEMQPIVFAAGGTPGVGHDGSRPDAITGEVGPSEATLFFRLFYALLVAISADEPSVVQVTTDCGGTTSTGRSEPLPESAPDGVSVEVPHPLFSYGTCTVVEAGIFRGDDLLTALPPELVGDDGSYEITAAESDPVPPSTDRFTFTFPEIASAPQWTDGTWIDDATTVRNVITAAPIEPGCSWLLPPADVVRVSDVLGDCVEDDQFWAFAASLTITPRTSELSDTSIGHAGSFVNPIGFDSSVGDMDAFRTSGTLFDQTMFPCGAGFIGITACTDDGGPMDAGGFVVVSIAFADDVPLDDDGVERAHVVDFSTSGGGEYRTELGPDGWTVSGPEDTRARSIIRGNSLTLVAPADELPSADLTYVLRTEVDGDVVEQPPVPVVGFGLAPEVPREVATPDPTTPTSDPATTDPPPATTDPSDGVDEAAIVDFYAQLSAGLSSGDLTFPLERLHPFVFDAYPDQCPAALESFVDPDFAVDVVAVGETGPWTWELPDGRSYDVDEATTVTVQVSGRGQSGQPADAHLATVDGQLRWFTFCA